MNNFFSGQYVKEFDGGPILEILRIYTDYDDDTPVDCAEVAEWMSETNDMHEYVDTYNISLESLMPVETGDMEL